MKLGYLMFAFANRRSGRICGLSCIAKRTRIYSIPSWLLALVAVVSVSQVLLAQESAPSPSYRNPNLAIEQRVADLLSRMTLEEKIEQIAGGRVRPILDTTGKFKPEDAAAAFRKLHGIDSDFSPRDSAVLRNAAQRYLVEKTR